MIFATVFDQHALAAFEANALGCLLKLVNRECLAHTIERACKSSGKQVQAESQRWRALAHATPLSGRSIIASRHNGNSMMTAVKQAFLGNRVVVGYRVYRSGSLIATVTTNVSTIASLSYTVVVDAAGNAGRCLRR